MNYSEQINIAFKAQKPFVAYKNPNENKVQVIIQTSDELIEFDDFSLSGYVFAPFNNDEKAYLIQPDVYFKDEVQVFDFEPTGVEEKNQEAAKLTHINIVKKAIKTIQETEISKIVVSRKEEVLVSDFNLLEVYNKLMNQYPNAYVYVWFHPKVGLWMGATPETLLNIENNTFKTMALAGTQTFKGDLNPAWGTKELEEQQMVSDFIKEHLENAVQNLEFSKVETVRAGSLLHLKTNISGTLVDSKDVETLVKLLHPTPAVCGLPKELSKKFILQNESYNRSYYSGYLGALNMANETSFFVNLRCFQYVNNKVVLYVGGGITAESNAEKEWEETVAKSQIIKAVL
ncbi:chorismate-binding protein [Wenyingzhuangia sp. chi5]|uniref:isochorismate synthase n=1 Tax=Wenyingzhuangia gilva TaxID=3057677 RepID=A0ABT8VRC7_9FLAO|nr:chorismate-binding protein [Wenyingzhuangia sp. chi5]MDO3694528.1 chorismate-binding protein [Wenyingzhuangia sp. chi5]